MSSGVAGMPQEGRVVDATELHRVVGPYTAEVYPVSVEDDYVVVSLR